MNGRTTDCETALCKLVVQSGAFSILKLRAFYTQYN